LTQVFRGSLVAPAALGVLPVVRESDKLMPMVQVQSTFSAPGRTELVRTLEVVDSVT